MKTIQLLALVTGICTMSSAFAEDSKPNTKDTYPLATCVVSGEKLGEMGKPFVTKYEGREVRLCCKGCLKDFNKDPKKFVAKLDEAEKAAKK